MRRHALIALLAATAGMTFPTSALGTDIRIKGYKWCGTKDFETGQWHSGASDGAFLDAYARNMSCTAARRNVNRVHYNRSGQPTRTGYRCRKVRELHEYLSVRCVKTNGRRAFRYITGA